MSSPCPTHLGNEDADDDAQLVQGAQRPSKGCRGHLPDIHGHEACGQAAVHTDDEAAQDQHLKGLAQFREAHEHSRHEGQQVYHQHRVPPGGGVTGQGGPLIPPGLPRDWVIGNSLEQAGNPPPPSTPFWDSLGRARTHLLTGQSG